jgi:hypothetical protein
MAAAVGSTKLWDKDFRVETSGLNIVVSIPLFSVVFHFRFRQFGSCLFQLFSPRGAVFKRPTLALRRRVNQGSCPLSTSSSNTSPPRQ